MGEEFFGPYRIDALLGRGGMGQVHRAFDTVRKRVVALKRLPPALAADPSFQARFRAESQLAARLNSAHVIPIHDYGEIDGQLYIDMRLVEGEDLADRLARVRVLTPAAAVRIIDQVAAALDAAHTAGLEHRDVKPSNVLISMADSDGGDFAYLVDFGIARAVDRTHGLTGTGELVGTLAYMAPERFTGAPSDHRVDIYALAGMLSETLTGHKPVNTGGAAAAMYAHLQLPPPRPSTLQPGIPEAFDTVVAHGMAKNPSDRYPTAGALAAAAREALRAPTGPRRPGPPTAQTQHHPGPQQSGPQQSGPQRTQTAAPPGRAGPSVTGSMPGSAPGRVPPAPEPGPDPAPNPALRSPAAPVPPLVSPLVSLRARRRWWPLTAGAVVLVAALIAATGIALTSAQTPGMSGGSGSSAGARPVRIAEILAVNATNGIALDPDNQRFFTGRPGSGTDGWQVETHGIRDNAATATLALPADRAINNLVISPDGSTVFVSTSTNAATTGARAEALAVIDVARSTITATVPMPDRVSNMTFSPDGSRLYALAGPTLVVLNSAQHTIERNINTGQSGIDSGVAATPDGRSVLVAGSSGVKTIDPASGATTASLGLRDSPAGIAVTPDGRRALVTTSLTNSVTVLDLGTGQIAGAIPVGGRPGRVAITPDGSQALVTNQDTDNLSVIDLATSTVTPLAIGSDPRDLVISADGTFGLITTSSNIVRFERT